MVTVLSSKYMVFDRKSIPIVACNDRRKTSCKNKIKKKVKSDAEIEWKYGFFCAWQTEMCP